MAFSSGLIARKACSRPKVVCRWLSMGCLVFVAFGSLCTGLSANSCWLLSLAGVTAFGRLFERGLRVSLISLDVHAEHGRSRRAVGTCSYDSLMSIDLP